MKVTRAWLQSYFDAELPSAAEIADAYTFHSFEIEEAAGDLLDVKVLPNRAADCLSVRGLAKELSAILDIPLKSDPLREPLPEFPKTKELSVAIEDPKKCLRYMGALVKGVNVGPSPAWLREALESVGQRSINTVVDATNFVMLNIGQPLHAFDAAKLAEKGGKRALAVRAAGEREPFTTLAGEAYELSENAEIVADGTSGAALALAGIKGGKAAEISAATKDIIIESANFDGTSVRRTAQAVKLFTDASARFQNRPSPELAAYGMRDALALIADIAGGAVAGVTDEYPGRSAWQYRVGVSAGDIASLLGRAYAEEEIADVFRRLGLAFVRTSLEEVLDTQASGLVGKAYKSTSAMRLDAPAAFSCSSLVSYLFTLAGYWMPSISIDKYAYGVPVAEPARGDLVFSNTGVTRVRPPRYETVQYRPGTKVPEGVDHVGICLGAGNVLHATQGKGVVIEDLAASEQFKNIVGYRRIAPDAGERRFVVTVPFERADLRIKEDLVEEVGRIVGYDRIPPAELPPLSGEPDQARYRGIERMKDQLVEQGFTEISTQSFAERGDITLANPLDKRMPALRTTLEQNLEAALAKAKHYAPLALGPGAKPKLFEVGTVFPKEGEHLELRMTERVPAWGESAGTSDNLSVAKLEDYGAGYAPKRYELGAYRPFSTYPFIVRDIALWCPAGTAGAAIEKTIRARAGELLARADQFDRFEKEGSVSYAFRLVFASAERTLTDGEANGIMEKISAALTAEGFDVR